MDTHDILIANLSTFHGANYYMFVVTLQERPFTSQSSLVFRHHEGTQRTV